MTFCTQCGARLAGTPFCSGCGARVADTIDSAPVGSEPVTASASPAHTAWQNPAQAAPAPATPTSSAAGLNGDAPSVSGPAAASQPADRSTAWQPPAAPAPRPSGPDAQTAAPSTRQFQLVQLTNAQTTAAGRDGFLALLGLVAGATVIIAAVAGLLGPDGHHGSPIDWFHAAIVMLGVSVHAAVELHVTESGTDSPSAGAVTAGLTLMPFLVTLLIFTANFLLARRSERRTASSSPRECVSQAAVTAAAFAVGAALLALVTQRPLGFGTGEYWLDSSVATTVGANPWVTLLGAFLVAGAGSALGRTSAFARRHDIGLRYLAGGKAAAWVDDLTTVRALLVAVTAAAVTTALVAGAWELLSTLWSSDHAGGDSTGSGDSASAKLVVFLLLAGLTMLANALVVVTGFLMGGTLGASGTGDALNIFGESSWSPHLGVGSGLLAGGVPALFYLAWLPLLLVALAVGLRAALRRSPRAELAPHVWRTVIVFAVTWAVLGYLSRVGVQLSGQAAALNDQGVVAGKAGAGLGVPSTVGAAAAWALICTVGGAYLTRWVGAALPGLAARLAGPGIDPQWQLLLADAAVRRERKVPASLTDAAAALQAGATPDAVPLNVWPSRDRILLGAVGALLLVAVAAPIGYHIINSRVFGPQTVATDYFDALSRKDASGALQLVEPWSLRDQDKTLLVSDALQDPARLESIVATKIDGDNATVVVRERIGETVRRARMTLHRSGHRGVLFDRWQLQSPFTDLSVSTMASADYQAATVNGVHVKYRNYPVFPGRYQASAAASDYYESASNDVDATGAGFRDVTFDPVVSDKLQQAADAAVHTFLDTCAAQGEAEPSDCPFSYYNYNYDNLNNVNWTITTYPSADVTVNDDGTITVDADQWGQAAITATGTDWLDGTPKFVSRTVNIDSFTGTLDWSGGDPSYATMSYDY